MDALTARKTWRTLEPIHGAIYFAAAIRATTLGKPVVMIERGTFGGTCVNTGCVPSKALIAAAEARQTAAEAGNRFPGIATTADDVDMPALISSKQDLVEELRGEKYVDVADAYGADPEFAIFWRSLESYRNTMNKFSKTLTTDMEYFRYLYDQNG